MRREVAYIATLAVYALLTDGTIYALLTDGTILVPSTSAVLLGPTLWSALPEDMRLIECMNTFNALFKTHYFMLAFNI